MKKKENRTDKKRRMNGNQLQRVGCSSSKKRMAVIPRTVSISCFHAVKRRERQNGSRTAEQCKEVSK